MKFVPRVESIFIGERELGGAGRALFLQVYVGRMLEFLNMTPSAALGAEFTEEWQMHVRAALISAGGLSYQSARQLRRCAFQHSPSEMCASKSALPLSY